jgi:predicted nuclease with TOPRIM domain
MEIKQHMELKWKEITDTKNEREALFSNFEANKDRISELYFEIEIKQLQYMLLKRKQLSDLKIKAIDTNSIEGIEKVNETCIHLTRENLVLNGYMERLLQEGLV